MFSRRKRTPRSQSQRPQAAPGKPQAPGRPPEFYARQATRTVRSRTFWLMLVMGILVFVILFFQLYHLQITRHKELQTKALDQQTLARLIQAAVQGEDVSGYAVEVGQVTGGIRQQLAQELKNGLEIRPSKKVGAGFRLAAKDGSGYFDCSDQEIAEMLMPFFRDMHL